MFITRVIFFQPQEVFESFDPKPLGAASLAQVHKVKLKDGRTIALKVQHPTVKSNSSVDLKTMEVSWCYIYLWFLVITTQIF